MYIAKHINCNTKELSRISLGKWSRDTWLISNSLIIKAFGKVCIKWGSQVELLGIDWDHDDIPSSKLIFRDDNNQLIVKNI